MNQSQDTMPDAVSNVVIKRITRTRTPQGDYEEDEAGIDVSPVSGYCYRRNPSRNRIEAPEATLTAQTQIILSLPGLSEGDVLTEDIVYLPACRATNGQAQRALVQQVRVYPQTDGTAGTRLQCDLEFGVQQQDM